MRRQKKTLLKGAQSLYVRPCNCHAISWQSFIWPLLQVPAWPLTSWEILILFIVCPNVVQAVSSFCVVHPPPCGTCNRSHVTYQVSHVRCHVSGVTCQVLRVTCNVSSVTIITIFLFILLLFYLQSNWACQCRVCYQQDLPRLVSCECNFQKL